MELAPDVGQDLNDVLDISPMGGRQIAHNGNEGLASIATAVRKAARDRYTLDFLEEPKKCSLNGKHQSCMESGALSAQNGECSTDD